MQRMGLAGLCVLLALPSALRAQDAPASRPAELTVLQTIQNNPEGTPSRLRHNTGVHLWGDFLYVSSYYGSAINYFRRDAASGELAFAGAVEFEGQYRGTSLAIAGDILYAVLTAGHATSDRDCEGLLWYRLDAKTGKPTLVDKIKCGVGPLILSADGRTLYHVAVHQKKIEWYKLDADGTPKVAGGMQAPADLPEVGPPVFSPDGRNAYIVPRSAKEVIVLAVAEDGALKLVESVDLKPLGGEQEYKSMAAFCSPDGRQVYVNLWYWGADKNHLGVYSRDPKTGKLTLAFENEAPPRMFRIVDMAFDASGRVGYYISGSESSGNCIGWVTRDPETGRLTFGGLVAPANRSGPNCMTLDRKLGVLYVGTWNTDRLYVLAAPAAKAAQ